MSKSNLSGRTLEKGPIWGTFPIRLQPLLSITSSSFISFRVLITRICLVALFLVLFRHLWRLQCYSFFCPVLSADNFTNSLRFKRGFPSALILGSFCSSSSYPTILSEFPTLDLLIVFREITVCRGTSSCLTRDRWYLSGEQDENQKNNFSLNVTARC